MTKIKICGLKRECDVDYVNEALPEYAGFILHYPKSFRNLDLETARQLMEGLAPGIKSVIVMVDQPMQRALDTFRMLRPDVIQLHGQEDASYIRTLKEQVRIPVWKAFRIRDRFDLKEAGLCPADKILLDGGYGEGRAFDWSLPQGFGRSFILAGGLTPENIPEAVRTLGPEIVDISSGVETGGYKDREKILAAVRAAHA